MGGEAGGFPVLEVEVELAADRAEAADRAGGVIGVERVGELAEAELARRLEQFAGERTGAPVEKRFEGVGG